MAKRNQASAAEDAVRAYLQAVSDPASLIDEELVAKLQQEADATSDPLHRVSLLSQMHAAQSPDVDALEEAFIEHVGAWAEENSIVVDAFLDAGVEPTVLRKAGFKVSGPARRSGPRQRRGPQVAGRTGRVPDGTYDAALADVWSQGKTVTLPELRELTGFTLGQLRPVVKRMVAAGEAEDLGPQPNHSGPGRAPVQYRRVAS